MHSARGLSLASWDRNSASWSFHEPPSHRIVQRTSFRTTRLSSVMLLPLSVTKQGEVWTTVKIRISSGPSCRTCTRATSVALWSRTCVCSNSEIRARERSSMGPDDVKTCSTKNESRCRLRRFARRWRRRKADTASASVRASGSVDGRGTGVGAGDEDPSDGPGSVPTADTKASAPDPASARARPAATSFLVLEASMGQGSHGSPLIPSQLFPPPRRFSGSRHTCVIW